MEREEISKEEEMEMLLTYRFTPKLFEGYGLKMLDIVPKRGIYRVETNEGFQCLKKIKYNKRNLTFIDEAIEHLVDNGFNHVARIRKTLDGHLCVRDGDDLYVMMDWMEGRECDYNNPIELTLAVKTLAKLHDASRGFNPSVKIKDRYRLGKWPQIFRERVSELKAMKEMVIPKRLKSTFDEIFLRYVDYYYRDGMEALEAVQKFSYDELVEKGRRERIFCHNDYAYHNVLISHDNTKVTLLDFDYCILDLRINDIGSIIHRNLKKCNWHMERAKFILDGYDQESPLSSDERKGIYTYLLFPTDFWRISYQYYMEEKEWPEEAFISRMIEKTECRGLRKDFLKEFKKMTGM